MMTLTEYIHRHLRVPFCYGEVDCVLFAMGWVAIKTGDDKLADLPRWKNHRQAQRVIDSVGGIVAGADARMTRIDPRLAMDGDVALVNGALCIFSGVHIVGPGEDGLKFINRMEAEAAWTV